MLTDNNSGEKFKDLPDLTDVFRGSLKRLKVCCTNEYIKWKLVTGWDYGLAVPT